MTRLRIKNWKTFQHYDHRCPPWIKLHFKMLSSRDWVSASDTERVLAIACMLVASQDEAKDGSFDADPDYIQRVAYLNSKPDFKPLIDRGFLELLADASACKQKLEKGCTETEKSREEKETDGPQIVFEIAKAHPKLSHLRDESEIPHAVVDAIIQAVQKDNRELVLMGTRSYASTIDNPSFALDPYKFFSQFHYRRDWNAKPVGKFTQLLATVSEPYGEPGEQFRTTGDR